mmetsp:Transcript_15050/g.32227  ORF Transcript_15050/g.32227 Transcript_15050/m.32227 type:complete len:85 (+) Transcript_15050:122-376(+)
MRENSTKYEPLGGVLRKGLLGGSPTPQNQQALETPHHNRFAQVTPFLPSWLVTFQAVPNLEFRFCSALEFKCFQHILPPTSNTR